MSTNEVLDEDDCVFITNPKGVRILTFFGEGERVIARVERTGELIKARDYHSEVEFKRTLMAKTEQDDPKNVN